MKPIRYSIILAFAMLASAQNTTQHRFDLLLQHGHVVDAKNGISAIRDVGIKDGKVAAVAEHLDAADALKTVDVSGLYVSPGLVDIHVHVYGSTGERNSYAGDNSLFPDGYMLRVGVTSVADAGCSGWRNFEDFKEHIIDRSKTRVFAFINIVGAGMRGPRFEDNTEDMEPGPAAEMAKKYKNIVVGFKTAHYAKPDWTSVDHAVEAGKLANLPVMVDFGNDFPQRPIEDLLTKHLRPGDIYTHCYSGLRRELLNGKVNPGMIAGRQRGVIFDVGHGGGSFAWRIAVPMMQQGFLPDSISTDIHIGSMNSGMKDMDNLMSKFLALGMSVDDVIAKSTWNPAKEIHHEELGNLSVGASADVAVLRVENGHFGFTDMYGARMDGTQKFVCELTLRDGKVVYDLNGITRPLWTTLPAEYRQTGDPAWDSITPARSGRGGRGRGGNGGRGGAAPAQQ